MREKDGGASYALSLSYQCTTKHYLIDKRNTSGSDVYAIDEGPTFDNLMDVSTLILIVFFIINILLKAAHTLVV